MISNELNPKLTVVGAGPGDPDLITLKGIKALSSAHVVLYDALVNKELLSYADDKAIKVYVGKRAGQHSYSQETINELIVGYALEYGHVVRLKGGDPFIFGRGHEEIAYARQHGLEVEVVPGISSATAVPAYRGIPVTSRGYSESFWVITGTTKRNQLSQDVALAAQSTATVVILMGMKKLSQIVQTFKTYGKDKLPVAIIQNGTTENEKVGYGTISDIEQKVAEKKLASPAIIVVGEVVNLAKGQLAQLQEEVKQFGTTVRSVA